MLFPDQSRRDLTSGVLSRDDRASRSEPQSRAQNSSGKKEGDFPPRVCARLLGQGPVRKSRDFSATSCWMSANRDLPPSRRCTAFTCGRAEVGVEQLLSFAEKVCAGNCGLPHSCLRIVKSSSSFFSTSRVSCISFDTVALVLKDSTTWTLCSTALISRSRRHFDSSAGIPRWNCAIANYSCRRNPSACIAPLLLFPISQRQRL